VNAQTSRPTGFRSVLEIGEFRALFTADLLSKSGDQLARVSLSVLVYQRTQSAALTGLTYALTYLPKLLGGVLLGGLADRWPRRDLLVLVDICRAALTALMALPGMPLPLVAGLLAAMTLLGAPHTAAYLASLADVLPGEKYPVGQALRIATNQSTQIVGFGLGGAAVAMLGPETGLAVNAATFAASAVITRFGLRRRLTPRDKRGEPGRANGFALIWRDRRVRSLIALSCLTNWYIAPEGLAAPYAAEIGAGAAAVGLIMAADPVGSTVGALVFGRWTPPDLRSRSVGVLAVLAGLPLLACALRPRLAVSLLLFAVGGVFAAGYQLEVGVELVRLVPDTQRGRVLGVYYAGHATTQGLGVLAAGAMAAVIGPSATIAVAGLLGMLVAVPCAITLARTRRHRPQTISGLLNPTCDDTRG
jgi:predicted MFS family arabinose efflux permease